MAAPDPLRKNEIAMRGSGYYNANSSMQRQAIKPALDLIPDLSHATSVNVVDYCCSQGANSIAPLVKLLSTLPANSTASILFDDTPSTISLAGHEPSTTTTAN
ncbi:hypothetical protein VTN77DRAFT_1010 [Rasamsonia byssochlamydoides]|uniref:uncharacterized protein n=1 Tax=Rasamsonia byssochlamydoides TaxID=89139 RepID=UPI0037449642